MIYITDDDLLQMRYHSEAGGDVLDFAAKLGYPINKDLVKQLFSELIYIKDYHHERVLKFRVEKKDENGIGAAIRKRIRELYTADLFEGAAIGHYYKYDDRISNFDKDHPEYLMKQVKLPMWMASIADTTAIHLIRNKEDLEKITLRPIDEERKLKGTLSVDYHGGYPEERNV